MQTAFLWLWLWWSGSTDGGVGASPAVSFTVLVIAEDGRPLPGESVVAVDEAGDAIVGVAVTDGAGQVQMTLPDRRTGFTVMSPRYQLERSSVLSPRKHVLQLYPLPDASGSGPREAPVVRTRPPLLIRGRVVDEKGSGLGFVRVDAVAATQWSPTAAGMRAKGVVIASAMSGAGGAFSLPIPSGDTQIQPRATGMVMLRSTLMTEGGRERADRPVLVMGAAQD